MAFTNYQAMENKYPSGRMAENIRRLKDYDLFHCLLLGGADKAKSVKQRVSDLPFEFFEWLEVCNGGMLFDTAMLTTKSHDVELDLDFETYADYFNADLRKAKNISESWFVFAVAVHSDVYFFDRTKNDGKVYQWDLEEGEIYAVWETFEDWLTDQINEAIDLIADEQLEPLEMKLEVEDNG